MSPEITAPEKWALLIGINRYPNFSPRAQLTGCVNDVLELKQVLTGPFAFPEDHITVLTDGEATQAGIRAAMAGLVERTGQGDVVVFHFSGHGSQMKDVEGDEPDGLDETIVPYDSGRDPEPNRDIKDDEIYVWLKKLTARTSNVTLIFDCCHSGTIDRDAFGYAMRWVEPDLRPEWELPPSPISQADRELLDGGRDIGPSGWLPLGERFVLFAGCRQCEKAYEMEEPPGVRHGTLSFHLAKQLLTAVSGTTYRDVFEAVAPRVSAQHENQHPQLEGARDREVFGVRSIEPMKFVPVLERKGDQVVLGGGATCGMTEGSEWALYPEGTKAVDTETEPLGIVYIEKVQAVTSVCELLHEARPGAVARGVRAVELGRAVDARMVVEVRALSVETWDIEALRESICLSRLLRLADPGEVAAACVYLLPPRMSGHGGPVPRLGTLREETWAAVGDNGELLMPPHPRKEPMIVSLLVENLEKRARYRMTMNLANPGSPLAGKVTAELFRWADGRLRSPEKCAGGHPVFYEGDALGLRVTNHAAQPLFIYVLDLGVTGRIRQSYPHSGVEDSLTPGRTLEIGTLAPEEDMELFIPDELPFLAGDPGRDQPEETDAFETLKIIASTHPADLYPLFQSGVRGGGAARGLNSLLDITFGGGGYHDRDLRTRFRDDVPEDWTAFECPFRLRRHHEPRLAAAGAREL